MNQESDNNNAGTQDLLDREALSALMDNELSDFEVRRLLGSLTHRPELLLTWERYNLSRAALRSEPLRSPSSLHSRLDFSEKTMAAVDAEPARYATKQFSAANGKPMYPSWLAPAGRVAVAASVTLAVFLGMQQVLRQDIAGSDSALADSSSAGMASANVGVQVAVDTEAQQRLNDYIRSVSIPARAEVQSAPYNVLLESPLLRPVSDRELIEEIERD
jgi:negative regulator of sigma E activity